MDNLKLPPHSIQAEQSVLGSLLLDNNAFDQIHDLQANEFYQATHAEIYKTISEMLQDRKEVDVLTLSEKLNKAQKLDYIGGYSYLAEISNNTPTAVNIKRYAEIVHEKHLLRCLLQVAYSIENDVYSVGEVMPKLDRAQASVMRITETSQSGDPVFVNDLLPSRFDHFEKLFNGEANPIGTGLKDLDYKLGGGFENGQLVVVAGRPAMGKSALAVQIAEHIQNPEAAGLIFSCEMSNAQIVDRIISGQAKLPSDVIRNGKFKDTDWYSLTAIIPKIQKMNLLVDDKAHTVNSISSKARTIKRKYGLSVIVVDYLQLLEGVGEIREQQVASISRGLKKLALELQVPILALSQLNRSLESRPNKRPFMSDIRESGAIEQDADVIIGIYRDEEYNPDSHDKGTAELLILKNRSGKTGNVRTTFLGEYTRFENFEGIHYPETNVRPIKQSRGFD